MRDDDAQIEAGLVRCNNSTVDNNNSNCNNDVFVEDLHVVAEDPVARCHDHGTISNGAYYTIKLRRDTASGNDFYPILFQSETPYMGEDTSGLGQTVTLWSWAEHTNNNQNTMCGDWGAGHANYMNWQHLNLGSGWAAETSSSAVKNWLPDPGVPSYKCWNVTDLTGTGDFSVNK